MKRVLACSYSNCTAQRLQMEVCKSLATISHMILKWLQTNFAAKLVANEVQCLKAMQRPALTGQASIFNLKNFWEICCNATEIIIYCVSDQTSISWFWRSFLNFKFSVLTYLRLISCSMRTEQNCWVLSGLDIPLEQYENNIPACKKLIKVVKYDTLFTVFVSRSIWTQGLVVKASSSESGNTALILAGCWNFVLPLSHFVWHWASQCQDTCSFILLHS